MWGSVNVPGGSTQGADGKSAYQIAVENGFSGTEAEWLASLKGTKGDKGDTGPTGATGTVGPAGPGLPAGGTAGQVPVKNSGTDYDTQWKTLSATDIGAAASDHSHGVYLPKENPSFTGNLYTTDGTLNIMSTYGTCKCGGHVIGGSSSYSDAKWGLAIGQSSIIASGYSYVEVLSFDADTCTVTVDAGYASFWDALNDRTYSGIAYVTATYRVTSVNFAVAAFDATAHTIRLSGAAKPSEKPLLIILRFSSDKRPESNLSGLSFNSIIATKTKSTGAPNVAIGFNNCISSTELRK